MSLFGIVLFGFIFPVWLIFILLIIGAIIAWKLIRFTIKILILIIIFFIILITLDYFKVFDFFQNIFLNLS